MSSKDTTGSPHKDDQKPSESNQQEQDEASKKPQSKDASKSDNSSSLKVRGRGATGDSQGDFGYKKKVRPQKSVEGWIIFVRNVHEESQEEDVYDVFADFGEILNINVNLDRKSGFVKGYALIEYKNKEDAEKAIESMNGKEFREKIITVDWAFVEPPTEGFTKNGSSYEKDRRKRSLSPSRKSDLSPKVKSQKKM